MAPPTYGDLGKSARDVMGKGYHFSTLKLDVKTKTASGVEFSSGGDSNIESGKIKGSLETKYKCKEYGVTLTEKWTTDNKLLTSVELADKPVTGTKLKFEGLFSPQDGSKSGLLKTEYKHDHVAINSDVDLNFGGPTVNVSAVVGHQGFLAGYQLAYDSGKSKLTKNNFAFGYTADDFTLHTNVNDGSTFGASVHHKVNSQMETAVTLGWVTSTNETNFGIGCKYALNKHAFVRAKVNNSSHVGLGFQHRLYDGITLFLSTLIDSKNFNQGGHKVGMALEFEA